jgi:hypothetical protein
MRDYNQTKGMKMFEIIRHPIQSVRTIRYIASQLTPAHLEALKATKTKDGKDMVEERIVRELFPDFDLA